MRLTDLFSGKKKALEQQVEDLKSALDECNIKLAEKQEHINTTNAYWKKKLKEQQIANAVTKKAGRPKNS
jgi:hypothetical protein